MASRGLLLPIACGWLVLNGESNSQSSITVYVVAKNKPRTTDYCILACIGELKFCMAHLYETSRRDEKVRDPRRDTETFWAETETRPRR